MAFESAEAIPLPDPGMLLASCCPPYYMRGLPNAESMPIIFDPIPLMALQMPPPGAAVRTEPNLLRREGETLASLSTPVSLIRSCLVTGADAAGTIIIFEDTRRIGV